MLLLSCPVSEAGQVGCVADSVGTDSHIQSDTATGSDCRNRREGRQKRIACLRYHTVSLQRVLLSQLLLPQPQPCSFCVGGQLFATCQRVCHFAQHLRTFFGYTDEAAAFLEVVNAQRAGETRGL